MAASPLYMLQNIHKVPQRIANEKPPHSPGLFSNAIFKRNTCRMNASEDFIKIIYSIDKSGTGVPEPPSLAMLT